MDLPLWYARFLFQLAPTDIPLAYAFTKSVARTPFSASVRQNPGKPRRGIEAVLPEQPFSTEMPIVRFVWRYVSDERADSAESNYLLIQSHLCDEGRSFSISCSPAACTCTFRYP